jgi:hypothetical protein
MFENVILWWAFDGRASILYQVADVPDKCMFATCPFPGNDPVLYITIQV